MKWTWVLCVLLVGLPSLALPPADPMPRLRELRLAGCHEELHDELVKAWRQFHEEPNSPREAVAWMLLGLNDISMGDLSSARSELEEAEIRFTAVQDFFGAWLSIMGSAALEREANRTGQALSFQERGLILLERAADPQWRLSIASMRALAPLIGMPSGKLGQIEAFPDLIKPFMLRFAKVLTRTNYAATLMDEGQLQKAEGELTQAREDAAMFGGILDADLDYRLGQLRQEQWRLEEARESYLKALDGSPAIQMLSFGQSTQDLSILNHLATLDLFRGRVEEALAWNDRALKIARERRQPKVEIDELGQRADLLHKAGRYDDAISLYTQLSAMAVTSVDFYSEASAECDLGQLRMEQGAYGRSAQHLERAIELFQKLHEPYLEAAAWLTLTNVDVQLNLDSEATEALERARTLADKTGFRLANTMVDLMSTTMKFMKGKNTVDDVQRAVDAILALPDGNDIFGHDLIASFRASLEFGSGSPTAIEFRGNVGALQAVPLMIEGKRLFDRGEHDSARKTWAKALPLEANNDLRAGIFGLIAATYWRDGNYEEGIRNFQLAAKTMEAGIGDLKVEEMLAGYLGGNRHFYFDLLVQTLVHENDWHEAFAQSERARSRAFLQMIGNHRLNADLGADPGLVREAEILRTEIAAGERKPTKEYDLARLRDRYQTLLTRIKASNPEYASITGVEPQRLEEVQKDLPPDATLVSYFIVVNTVYVWVIETGDVHHAILPIDGEALRRITCWTKSIGHRAARGATLSGECDGGATSDEAFDLLIAPIRPWLRQRRLILVPHGVLHYVPFAALHDRSTDRYLIDDFTLMYAPSASSLRFLRAKETPVNGASLVLGDPETSLPRLPGAAQEATSIAQILGTTAHLGNAAQEALLYDLHGKTDLVHLAAHGIYNSTNPLFSRIALTGGGGHDGNLTVQDILSSVDLTGVNLVVLSSCQSAVGARSGGDEVVGMTRALLYAGTPGVISTLWDIDDTSAAGLMEEFYRRLRAGVPVADALREAQLATRAHYPNPVYWAAFMLTGDPQGHWPAQP